MVRVEEGETIGIIAAKYKTTVEDILVLNKVRHDAKSSRVAERMIQRDSTKMRLNDVRFVK